MNKKLQFLAIKTFMMFIASFFLLSCNSGTNTLDANVSEEPTESNTKTAADFEISLAQWSLHRTFFGGAIDDWAWFGEMLMESPDSLLQGEVDPMNFPVMARDYGVNAIELVNTFYYSKANDDQYWSDFKKKCDEAGVIVGLIMCDALGNLVMPIL